MASMRKFTRLIFPYGLLLLVLTGASLFFGADTPMTAFLFSGLLLVLGSAKLLASPVEKMPLAVLIGVGFLVVLIFYDFLIGRQMLAMPEYAVLFAAGAVFVLVEISARTVQNTTRLWQLMLVVFMAMGVWAFIDFAVNPEMIHGRSRPYHENRLSAAFLSANTAATFFGVAMLAASASILRALTKIVSLHPITLIESLFRHATLGMITFMFSIVCLLLTASRAGLAFSITCLLILCGWEFYARRKKANADGEINSKLTISIAVSAIVVSGILLWVLSGDVAGSRYAELDTDANSRIIMYNAYWQASLERPLMGHGLGSFSEVNNAIMTDSNAHILATQGAAHNVLLQWLVQAGWIGTIAMWLVLALIIRTIWQGLTKRHRYRTYLRTVLMMSLFVFLHGTVDYALEIPGLMWWWALVLGLGAGIAEGGGHVSAEASRT